MPDHRKVMGDEEIGQTESSLEVLQQIDDLGLDRDIEGRDRLIAHDKAGLHRKGPGDPDPLPLATRKLVGIPVSHVGIETYH